MKTISAAIASAVLCAVTVAYADDQSRYAPDNTGRNLRDRQENRVTPEEQSNTSVDLSITRSIRRQLVTSEGLSTNAKNVKVITQAGQVVLRGPVDSLVEKREVEHAAGAVAGPDHVLSRLEVVASQ